MTKILSLVFVTALAINAQAADKNDAKYFELTKVKMTDVTEQYSQNRNFAQAGLYEDCNTAQSSNNMVPLDATSPGLGLALDPIDQASIIVDKIINLGKKVWAIVETGRPVVSVQTVTANALPQGLTCWSDLTGWQIPQSKV